MQIEGWGRVDFLRRHGLRQVNEQDPSEVREYLRRRDKDPCPECGQHGYGELDDGCWTCTWCGASEVLFEVEEKIVPKLAPNLLEDSE